MPWVMKIACSRRSIIKSWVGLLSAHKQTRRKTHFSSLSSSWQSWDPTLGKRTSVRLKTCAAASWNFWHLKAKSTSKWFSSAWGPKRRFPNRSRSTRTYFWNCQIGTYRIWPSLHWSTQSSNTTTLMSTTLARIHLEWSYRTRLWWSKCLHTYLIFVRAKTTESSPVPSLLPMPKQKPSQRLLRPKNQFVDSSPMFKAWSFTYNRPRN